MTPAAVGRNLGDDLAFAARPHPHRPTGSDGVTRIYGRAARSGDRPYLIHTEEATGSIPVSPTPVFPGQARFPHAGAGLRRLRAAHFGASLEQILKAPVRPLCAGP